MSVSEIPDELRGKTPEELSDIVEFLDAQLRSLHQTDEGEIRTMDDAEKTAFDTGLQMRETAIDIIEEHRRISEVFRRKPAAVEKALFHIATRGDDAYGEVRRMNNYEARDRAMRVLDNRNDSAHLSADQRAEVERQLRSDPDIARRVILTENENYRNAWMKVVTRANPFLNQAEQESLAAFDEFRAMAEGTDSAGGYGVPVFIDPSIVTTAQGSGNPFLEICRQVQVNTKTWKGVSSAGVTWSFDAEAAEVSDDSPTLAQPTVDVHMARGFIPFSIEVGQDYPQFAEEMGRLLAEGYDELLLDKFTRGSGTGEPRGIVTALDANTNVEVASTTDGAYGQEDLYKVWGALGQRYRRNASWMMNVGINNRTRQFGTAQGFHASTVDITAPWANLLFSRPVYENPYMADFTGTTGAENRLIVGDFRNYVIARRGGMSIELVPHLFGLTNNRPTGQRGWFAYGRIGGNSVNDLGFRMLQNA